MLSFVRSRRRRHRRQSFSSGFAAASEPRRRGGRRGRRRRRGGVGVDGVGFSPVTTTTTAATATTTTIPPPRSRRRSLLFPFLFLRPLRLVPILADDYGRHVSEDQRSSRREVPRGVDDPADAAVAFEEGLRRGRQREPARGEELVPLFVRQREAEEPLCCRKQGGQQRRRRRRGEQQVVDEHERVAF